MENLADESMLLRQRVNTLQQQHRKTATRNNQLQQSLQQSQVERDFFSGTLRNYQSRSASPTNRQRPPQFLSLLPETRPLNTQLPQQEAFQHVQQNINAVRNIPSSLQHTPINRVVAPVVPFQQPAAPIVQ